MFTPPDTFSSMLYWPGKGSHQGIAFSDPIESMIYGEHARNQIDEK